MDLFRKWLEHEYQLAIIWIVPVHLQRLEVFQQRYMLLLKIMTEVGINNFRIAPDVIVLVSFMLYFALAVGLEVNRNILLYQRRVSSSRSQMFFKIDVLKNFTNFTWKHLQAYNFIKKRLRRRCFPSKVSKFLKEPFVTEHLWWLVTAYIEIKQLRWSFSVKIVKC